MEAFALTTPLVKKQNGHKTAYALGMSWVTNILDTCLAFKLSIISLNFFVLYGSSPAVGSSYKTTFGWRMIDLASPTSFLHTAG